VLPGVAAGTVVELGVSVGGLETSVVEGIGTPFVGRLMLALTRVHAGN
jgi:hypothetical protein